MLGTVIETEILRCGLDPELGFFHQAAYGRPSLMLDLLEEFRPHVDALTLRLINRRQLSVADFDRRAAESVELLLAGEAAGPASPAEIEDGDGAALSPLEWDASDDSPNEAGASAAPVASSSRGVVGVYLGEVGRRIFLREFFQRLREPLLYPPRQAALELRDIVREQAYHLARVIEGREPQYVPFVPHVE